MLSEEPEEFRGWRIHATGEPQVHGRDVFIALKDFARGEYYIRGHGLGQIKAHIERLPDGWEPDGRPRP